MTKKTSPMSENGQTDGSEQAREREESDTSQMD